MVNAMSTCRCGVAIKYTGVGRPRKYCSEACKKSNMVDRRPRKTSRRVGRDPEDRFFEQVVEVVTGLNAGCWHWTGDLTDTGYGRFYDAHTGQQVGAHRWLYERVNGPVDKKLDMDHQCHNHAKWCRNHFGVECLHRRCVNPDHLEPATRQENSMRGERWGRFVQECPAGHPYDDINTLWGVGGRSGTSITRSCRACKRLANQRRRAESSHA